MNDQTAQLIEQLKEKLIVASDELITRTIEEARQEALAEAKALLKERMLQAILESATQPQNKPTSPKPASGGTWFQPQPSL